MIPFQTNHAQTLSASLEAMLQNFPEIKVGQADVRIQESAIETARSQRLPQLGLSLRGGEERFRKPSSSYSIAKLGGFSFDASQLLFDGGSARSRVREARALNQLSEIELESTRQALALDLSQTYVDIIKFRTLLGFAEESARIHRTALDKTSQKYRAGAGPQADVELVTARLSMSEATLEARRRQLSYAVTTYRKYTALDPDQLEEPEFPDWAIPISIEEVNLGRNPNIRSALANISATEARHRGAQSAFFPKFDFFLQSNGSDSARNSNQQKDTSGLIVMSYDIFGGGRRKADLQHTLFAIDKATYELETTESELGAAFMNAWNDLTIAEDRLYRLEDYRDAMTSVVSAYQKQFELGQRALINVLDVENELFSAKSSVAEERYNRIQAAYRILSLNGTLLENLQ